eukprot:m.199770 g.199770  ORF g.199770 m.199770 type:complete len:461 (+) comp25178_c0_seq5:146-1528(+)
MAGVVQPHSSLTRSPTPPTMAEEIIDGPRCAQNSKRDVLVASPHSPAPLSNHGNGSSVTASTAVSSEMPSTRSTVEDGGSRWRLWTDTDCCGVPSEKLLKTTMPVAEVLLLISVLLIYLEVAPEDIPAVCSTKLHQACLDEYIRATMHVQEADSAEYDIMWLEMPCGSLRVECWRSGWKDILFSNQLAAGSSQWNASLSMCQCLLSGGRDLGFVGNEIPAQKAWRTDADNPYFCDDLKSINVLAFMGLLLGVAVYLTRSFIDEQPLSLNDVDEEKDKETSARRLMTVHRAAGIVAFLTLSWIVWSIISIVLLSDHISVSPSSTECQYPEAAIFAYVAILAVLSLVAGLYAVVVNLNAVFRGRTADLRRSTFSRGGRLLFIPSPGGEHAAGDAAGDEAVAGSWCCAKPAAASNKVAPADDNEPDARVASAVKRVLSTHAGYRSQICSRSGADVSTRVVCWL